MNLVFYDVETTGTDVNWSQIIQFGAVLVNEDFSEIDRYQSKCRLKPGVVPDPQALLVTGITISELTETNFSHYNLIKEIKRKFDSWTPAIFVGFNSIKFDEEIIRKSLFKSLHDVYITVLNNNRRVDLLNVVRSSVFFDKNFLNTTLTDKGNISFKLEELANNNSISHNAHDAMGDVMASIKLAKKIKENKLQIWNDCLLTSNKKDVENFLYKQKLFCLSDYNFGRMNHFPLTYVCSHPKYGYAQCFDLTIDPQEIIKLEYNSLKNRIKEKPSFIKSIAQNKHPLIFKENYFSLIEKFDGLDLNVLKDRANLIKKSDIFKQKLILILNEEFDEKEFSKPQTPIMAEESLYVGGFPSLKDKQNMKNFHQVCWTEKFRISCRFEDDRYRYFAQRLIYEENPQCLPKNVFNTIHKSIAEQILTLEDVTWYTLPKAYKKLDDLRDKFTQEKDEKKLRFLEKIDDYYEKMRSTYEPAKLL